MIFGRGNLGYRHGELQRSRFGENFPAQTTGQGQQAGGGQIRDAAFLDFLLDLFELLTERANADIAGSKNGLLERLQLDGLEVLDFEPELAAPVDESLPRDIEFGGDTVVALPLRAKEHELFLGFEVMHTAAR